MRFPKRQSNADAAQEEDPLSPYSAPTVRRSSERGGTEPLDEFAGGAGRPSDTQVGNDFATRNLQRRQRQGNTRAYPQMIGDVARRFDNRQLMMIGGAILLALVALLVWRATRSSAPPADQALDPAAQEPGVVLQPTTEATAGIFELPAGPIVTAEAIQPPGVAPEATEPAAAGTGQRFVVTGTGTAGLFLRSDHSTTANKVGTLPEGTQVEALGETFEGEGYTWQRVRTPAGEGWVAGQFLVPAP